MGPLVLEASLLGNYPKVGKYQHHRLFDLIREVHKNVPIRVPIVVFPTLANGLLKQVDFFEEVPFVQSKEKGVEQEISQESLEKGDKDRSYFPLWNGLFFLKTKIYLQFSSTKL